MFGTWIGVGWNLMKIEVRWMLQGSMLRLGPSCMFVS